MRRLGERAESEYGHYLNTLGRAVHDDYHLRVFLAFGAGGGRFDLEKTTERGDQLPAGPEGASAITVGKWSQRSQLYPRPMLMDELEKRTAALPDIERVLAAWRRLPQWEPNGEILYRVLGVDCLALTPTLGRRGFRHHDKQFWRQRAEAWEIVGVLAVQPDVLAAAEAAGAVDVKALAWARARGLCEVSQEEPDR